MSIEAPSIGVIAGDGVGPEVMEQSLKVLDAADPGLHFVPVDLGADRWMRTGEVLTDADIATLRACDAILLGAVGASPTSTTIPSGLLERGLLLRLRFLFDQGLNLRPSRYYPGQASPLAPEILNRGPIDFVVAREGTEGPYTGNGGVLRPGTPQELATEVSVNSAFGVTRVVEAAFAMAERRRGHLTLIHKHNVLSFAGGLWRRIVDEATAAHPNVTTDYLHVDAATIALVSDPQRFDVIVTDNLFGDILTDLAGAVTGGIGLAASANINLEGTAPSMFEPVHGSAPDIAGKGLADPSAMIGSTVLMLDHLGRTDAARRIQDALDADIVERGTTRRSTSEIGDAIAARVRG